MWWEKGKYVNKRVKSENNLPASFLLSSTASSNYQKFQRKYKAYLYSFNNDNNMNTHEVTIPLRNRTSLELLEHHCVLSGLYPFPTHVPGIITILNFVLIIFLVGLLPLTPPQWEIVACFEANKWSHITCILLCLTSISQHCSWDWITLCVVVVVILLLLLCNILWKDCNTIYLSMLGWWIWYIQFLLRYNLI